MAAVALFIRGARRESAATCIVVRLTLDAAASKSNGVSVAPMLFRNRLGKDTLNG
jgi:hypothetical protein